MLTGVDDSALDIAKPDAAQPTRQAAQVELLDRQIRDVEREISEVDPDHEELERLDTALDEELARTFVVQESEQRKGDVATALPSGLALAATFEPDLAFKSGAMIGAEARAKTFNVLLAGGVNLTRDPWAGRNFEYLGEDPLLAGEMAGASIRGVQSNHIVSTIKHFALNAQETGRHVMDAQIDEADLRESDLLAFQIAIEKGQPGSVMCAYNKVGGDWACQNDHLLNTVLKRDWNYPGWVMSDWGAVHSTVKAALAGLDQQSGQELDTQIFFGDDLKAAVAKGEVSQARLDDMVRRILHGVITSGLMDNPVPTTAQPIDYAAHGQVAQAVAERGAVLLKNDVDLLPLARTARTIVLIGAHADVGVLSGGGSSQVRSVGGVPVELPLDGGEAASFVRVTWHASSPLDAIRAAAPNAQVTYVDGKDPVAAAAAAKDADVAIVFAWHWQTEAQDAPSTVLPDNQDALIEAVAAANKNAVVVLETGGPVLMPWIDRVGAVLQAWYPGQRGGQAIARLLLGEVNPSGRLSMTFPRTADQAPRASALGFAEQAATPLGMNDTDFHVPKEKRDRLAALYEWKDGKLSLAASDFLGVHPDGPPGFASGGGGLFSTADDYARFGRMLLGEGFLDGKRVISRASARTIMSNHLSPQIVNGRFGVGIQQIRPGYQYGYNGVVVTDPAAAKVAVGKGAYLWDGLASTWFWVDPTNRIVFVGMVQRVVGANAPPVQPLTQSAVQDSYGLGKLPARP